MTLKMLLLIIGISAGTSLAVSVFTGKVFLKKAEKSMGRVAESAKQSMGSLYNTFMDYVNKRR